MENKKQLYTDIAVVLGVIIIAVALKLPLLVNAECLLDSDEAFNALAVKHLLKGNVFFLYYPGQDYQGITEGLLGVFYTKVFGWSALAYKLSSFTFYLLYLVAIYGLAREAFGRRAAAGGALLAAFTSPLVAQYSLLARGGHMAVPLAGTVLIYCLLRHESTRKNGWLYLLCGTAGFSYYTYKLSIVAIAPVVIYALAGSGAVRTFLAYGWRKGSFDSRPASIKYALRFTDIMLMVIGAGFIFAVFTGGLKLAIGPAVIRSRSLWGSVRWLLLLLIIRSALSRPIFGKLPLPRCKVAATCLIFLLIGLAPLFTARLFSTPDAKPSLFEPAGAAKYARNAEMLWNETLPRLLGYKSGSGPVDFTSGTGRRVLAVFYLTTLVYSVYAVLRRGSGKERRARLLLLLAVAVSLAAYCLGRYTSDPTSARYLIPLLTPAPVLMAGTFRDLSDRFRRKGLEWALVGLFCLIQAGESWQDYRKEGFVEGPFIREKRSGARRAAEYLRSRKVSSAYGTYWIAYHLTFLTDEDIVVSPYHGVAERKPPDYAPAVLRDPDPAYIFIGDPWDKSTRRAFRREVRRRAIPCRERYFPGTLQGIYVYHSAAGTFPHDL